MSEEQPENYAKLAQDICNQVGNNLQSLMEPQQYEDRRPIWETDSDFLNPYKVLPPVQTWATIGERKALPKEGIITFSAKQKKGKSFSTYAIALPLLSGMQFDTLTPTDRPNMVMVFDMEMSETTLTNRALNQVQAIGEYGARFLLCPLKAKSIPERIATIKAKVERYNPDIIVIDQAAKLVQDINGTEETNIVTDMLDKMSIGRSVWVVMHENKSDTDAKMRGHLGSYLAFAAVEAYGVDRKDGIFTITFKEGRDSDSDNAAPIKFTLDPNGRIIDAAAIARAAEDDKRSKWRSHMERIFGADKTLQRCDIISRIKSENQGIDAENVFSNARESGAIIKVGNDKRSPYKLA